MEKLEHAVQEKMVLWHAAITCPWLSKFLAESEFITLCPCIDVLLGTIHVCKWGGQCCRHYFYRDLVINQLPYAQH